MLKRFLSSAVHPIDAKGRVSIPAPFRSVIAQSDFADIYALVATDMPAINAGGSDLLDALERRMMPDDIFSPEAEAVSLYIHGDGTFLKADAEGRIKVSDFIRQATGVTDAVMFVGRGHFFQLWDPGTFRAHRDAARSRLHGAGAETSQ